MIDRSEIPLYRDVQARAKAALAQIGRLAEPGMTEFDIATLSVKALAAEGITETWYYAVPAFVLVGERSILSMSGRDYLPSTEVRLAEGGFFTVDLSPSLDGRWGDCARSFCVTAGGPPISIREGIEAEHELHRHLLAWAKPETSFDELFTHMNERIRSWGFENLDFAGNLGHSIELARTDRIYIEAGNSTRLGDVCLFTFEPHIRKPGSKIGVKHENIYYFDPTGALSEL
jgi:Xaa-Pro aminopeptidase